MSSVCLYLKVHIPHRLYFFQPGKKINEPAKQKIVQDAISKLADNCYLPANKIILHLINETNGKFRVNFSISGTAIDLLSQYRPDVLSSFKTLSETGAVDFLGETYYNSLSWLHSKTEFKRQVEMHQEKIETTFAISPTVFRNTELIYSNELAGYIAGMGFRGMLCEGLESILCGGSANQLYAAPGNNELSILLRNTRLSDDIAFRFDDLTWNEQPLTAEKFAGWIHAHQEPCNINLYFDYETFGIHKQAQTGILEFLKNLPSAILKSEEWSFKTARQVIDDTFSKDIFDSPQIISWQNKSNENCIWSENTMQRNALYKIYQLENTVLQLGCSDAITYWAQLQSADHFYNMVEQENIYRDVYATDSNKKPATEYYNNFKSLLTAFEIYLIEKGLDISRTIHRKTASYHLYAAIN